MQFKGEGDVSLPLSNKILKKREILMDASFSRRPIDFARSAERGEDAEEFLCGFVESEGRMSAGQLPLAFREELERSRLPMPWGSIGSPIP